MTAPGGSATAPAALLLLAAALVLGGHRVGPVRLARVTAPTPPAPTALATLRLSWIVIAAAALGSLGWVLSGPAAGVIAALGCLGAGLLGRHAFSRPPHLGVDGVALAAVWELLAVCLRAGLPTAAAVAAAAGPLPGVAGAELRRVAGLLELGADPPDAWRGAEAVPALATFARAAGRSAGTGAALAQVACGEGNRMRAELVDTAQARAQRAGVLITGPLGLCFLPAFLVLGIAPVVIGLAGEALARW